MESQNIEFRAVVKFLTKEGAKAKEIHQCMAAHMISMVVVDDRRTDGRKHEQPTQSIHFCAV